MSRHYHQAMDLVREFFGDAFTSYCLNISIDRLAAASLSPAQSSAVSEMEEFVRNSKQNPDEMIQRISMSTILQYHTPAQTSVPNALRQKCGGAIEAKDSADPVESVLFKLARDTYPACLIPPPASSAAYGFSQASTSVYQNPHCREAVLAVLSDPSLSKLFPGAPEPDSRSGIEFGAGITSDIVWSNGSGGSLQLIGVVTGILDYAARRISVMPSPNEYFSLVAEALKTARTLAEKKPAPTSTLVGLSNFTVDQKEPITFQAGQLRSPTPGDLADLMGEEGVSSVLDVRSSIQILSISSFGPQADATDLDNWERFRPSFEKAEAARRRQIDLARLAILFAYEATSAAPVEIATTTLIPIGSGKAVGFSVHRYLPTGTSPIRVTEEIGNRIQHWSKRTVKHPSNLDMGMRRLLSAASARFDPMDAFVDAVICWENMFGTNQGEVGFRVAGSLAHLLEGEDPNTRKELFAEIKNLYQVRSKLVHGSKEPSIQDAHAHKNRSIEIAIRAFKNLYDRPELLAVDSAARSNILLIGA